MAKWGCTLNTRNRRVEGTRHSFGEDYVSARERRVAHKKATTKRALIGVRVDKNAGPNGKIKTVRVVRAMPSQFCHCAPFVMAPRVVLFSPYKINQEVECVDFCF